MQQGFTGDSENEITDEEVFKQVIPEEQEDQPINDFSRYLSPAVEIPKKSYSLEPDMLNGWRPPKRILLYTLSPFGLTFENRLLDPITRRLLSTRSHSKYSVVYLGERPSNSYQLHENIANQDSDYANPYPYDKRVPGRSQRPFIGMNPRVKKNNSLVFDSNFESGNLDAAIKVDDCEYDLFMRVDTNTKGHTNWYYFTVANGQFLGKVRFNICNFQKTKSLYQRVLIPETQGMKPYVLSAKLQEKYSMGWRQAGNDPTYLNTTLRYRQDNSLDEDSDEELFNFVYSFTYDFGIEGDATSFAYCVPYTYTRLNKFLHDCKAKFGNNFKLQAGWKSLSGLNVPLLTITDDSLEPFLKSLVVVSARVHPGQSNSSHVVEGLIKYLCSEEEGAKQLIKKVIFKIIPMVNPDGVVAGNYRTSFFGKDLNRTYHQQRKHAFPEVYHLKEFIKEEKRRFKRIYMFIDLHGHSVKKNVFIYGPQYPISEQAYYQCRQLPRLLSTITSMFRFYSCIFKISLCKDTTARAIVNRTVPVTNCYTVEASNGFYYDRDSHQELPFTAQMWEEMGVYIAKAILESLKNAEGRLRLSQFRVNDRQTKRKMHRRAESDSPTRKEDLTQLKNFYTNDKFEKCSDDNISEGSSDSQPPHQDMEEEYLNKLEASLNPNPQEPVMRQTIINEPKKKDHSELESMLVLNHKVDKAKRACGQEKLPPLNLTSKFRLVSVSKDSRKRDQVAYDRQIIGLLRLLQLSSEASGLTFIKAPSPSPHPNAVTQSINNLVLGFNEKTFPDPRGFHSESINYVRRRGEDRYRAESVKQPAHSDLRNSTNAFQAKLDKIFGNRY